MPLLRASHWLSRPAVAEGLEEILRMVCDGERNGKVSVLVALLRRPSRAQGSRFESRRSELHPALYCPRSPISVRSVSVTHSNSHPSLHYVPLITKEDEKKILGNVDANSRYDYVCKVLKNVFYGCLQLSLTLMCRQCSFALVLSRQARAENACVWIPAGRWRCECQQVLLLLSFFFILVP